MRVSIDLKICMGSYVGISLLYSCISYIIASICTDVIGLYLATVKMHFRSAIFFIETHIGEEHRPFYTRGLRLIEFMKSSCKVGSTTMMVVITDR